MSKIYFFWFKARELGHHQRRGMFAILSLCALLLLFSQCVQPSVKQEKMSNQFILPAIPTVLTASEERIKYLVLHYWDNFDFSDTTLISNAQLTEQAFADYINLFSKTSTQVVEQSISTLLGEASKVEKRMFDHFVELFEKYLYDPNSPFRQEDYYIAVLRSIIDNDCVEELFKFRTRYLLQMACKNRPGEKATDFEFEESKVRSTRLYKILADYLILFFNNPDCHDCSRVKEVFSESPVIGAMMKTGSKPFLRIVAIYSDDDLELWRKAEYPSNWINGYSHVVSTQQLYELRAMPTLYLLDNQKRVILKDATVEQILQHLSMISEN